MCIYKYVIPHFFYISYLTEDIKRERYPVQLKPKLKTLLWLYNTILNLHKYTTEYIERERRRCFETQAHSNW